MDEKEFLAEIRNLDQQINELEEKRSQLVSAYRAFKSPHKIGDIVERQGKRYQITGFAEYWPMGKLILKDGSLGKDARNLYNI